MPVTKSNNFVSLVGGPFCLFGLYVYPEWPHRQCVGLAFRRSHVRGSLECSKSSDLSPHCTVEYVELRGTALCRVGGATSQLDLPSLTPLSVTGCGQLQLGAPNWITSVNYCK